MKLELNFYKSTGKWYTKEEVDVITLLEIENFPKYRDMNYTVHIIESDGYLQPYRMFKRSVV